VGAIEIGGGGGGGGGSRNQVLCPNIIAFEIVVEWKETATKRDMVVSAHFYYGCLGTELYFD
jgi:hypothetical protein